MSAENREPISEICLLDIPWNILSIALSDPETAKMITDYDRSSVVGKIDELANLVEVPSEAYILNTATVQEIRHEWTVQMPTSLYQKIMSFRH